MKLIVLIYLRAVRINQLKVKNWVAANMSPVSWHRPQLSVSPSGERETLVILVTRGAWPVTTPPAPSTHLTGCQLSVRILCGKIDIFSLVKFADRVKNKCLCIIPCPLRTCQCLSVTQKRRRVSDSVKVSSPSVTHLSRSRDNIVRAC